MTHSGLGNLLFSFRGRVNRKPYWLASIGILVAFFVALVAGMTSSVAVLRAIGNPPAARVYVLSAVFLALFLPFLWMWLAVTVKRLHDRDKSWVWLFPFVVLPAGLAAVAERLPEGSPQWWVALLLTLGFSLWALIEVGFVRGTMGPNAYGPDPLAGPPSSSPSGRPA